MTKFCPTVQCLGSYSNERSRTRVCEPGYLLLFFLLQFSFSGCGRRSLNSQLWLTFFLHLRVGNAGQTHARTYTRKHAENRTHAREQYEKKKKELGDKLFCRKCRIPLFFSKTPFLGPYITCQASLFRAVKPRTRALAQNKTPLIEYANYGTKSILIKKFMCWQ